MTTETESKKYNGWTNYETWAVKLWMDNDEGSQRYWSEQADEVWEDARADSISTREQRARWNLAEILKDEHNEALPELEGFAADLLSAAMSEVDWYEIAESLLTDARDDDA